MCIPSTTIAGPGQHLFDTCIDIPSTEDVGLPTKFRLNVGPASQPIAGSMPVDRLQRWPNTNIAHNNQPNADAILVQCV